MKRLCLDCPKVLRGHFSRKRCEPCAAMKRKRPASTLTPAQIRLAKTMIGKMDRKDIALALGTSLANLKRAFRGTRLAFYNYCTINPDLVHSVNKYFETHSLRETAEHFGLKCKQVDHIVYRYRSAKPKQIRWTDKQIAEAAKMSGLVSLEAQAKYFNRPGAYAGSIKSLWTKRFGFMGGQINGMFHNQAKHFVDLSARYIKTKRGPRVILWVVMEDCLKPEVPTFMREAIMTLADFQRWLWRTENPKPLILKMIREREAGA